MSRILEDVKDVIAENADENLMEGAKVVRDLVVDTAHELDQHKKQATAAAAIAAVLAAGGAAALDDADMEAAYEAVRTPNPVVLEISDPPADADDEDKNRGGETQGEVREEETSSIRQLASRFIIAPLYMLGSGLMMIIKGIVTVSQVPVLGAVVRWGIIALAILGTLALALKLAFPGIPLKKILNKKCVSFVFASVAVISIASEVAALFYPAAGAWIDLVQVLAGFGILVSIYVVFARAFSRKKTA